MFMKRSLLLIFIALCLVSIIQAQDTIDSVDFKNFTYKPYCASPDTQTVSVKDGEFSSEKQMDGWVDRFYFAVFDVALGDLDGDGKNEAVVLTTCNTGGTGNFSEGFIYKANAGKPLLIARIPGGDRAYGGLRSANIENGQLIIKSNEAGEEGGACCPQYVVTTRYRLTGSNLAAMGKPLRHDLFPKERITFARGTSGRSFETTIPPGEGKRFIVNARAGQILRVSTSSNDISLHMLVDSMVTEGVNSFSARLKQNGDHVFLLQNDADHELTVTVNVKIN